MRKVEVKGETSFSKELIWHFITDLKRYPKHVKFVKSVSFSEPLYLGSQFSDITTIAYIPLKVTHKVDVFEKEKSLGFYVKMPLTGYMIQRVNIKSKNNKRELGLSIEFDFQNRLFDFVLGKFLEKRIREMLLYILESEKFLNGKS